MSKLAEILRTPTNWARKWSAGREQAILWCQSRLNRFPARTHAPLRRINLLMRAIQSARGVLSAHMFAERTRATAISLSGASVHFENLSLCWVSVRKGFYDDLTSSVRFHRILRRGREYGSELLPEEALQPAPPNESPRGLHFICLNANISRQFEFLQNAWIANTKFSGITGESDPLLGNRESLPGCPVTGNFTIPGDGTLRRRVSGLPQFVTVRGGAYFFLPSLRALRYFAGA